MLRFLFRRLLIAIPTMFIVVTLAFFMMRAAPGSPFVNERHLSPEVEANVMAKYGMNRPLAVQYATYVGGVLHGDLGPSLKYKDKTVLKIISEGFPHSLLIGGLAMTIAAIVGVSLGVVGALRQNGPADYTAMGVAVLGVCIPTFVTAPLLVLLFASMLGVLPTGGWPTASQPLSSAWRYFVMPVAVLSLPQIAIISRLTRAGMIEVLRSNYVRTARAKGLPEHSVVLRHALRGAILPLVSYLGPATAGVITGSLVVERIFSLPGIGRAFVASALQRDYTVVMGVVILYAGLILFLNLVADVLYAALDPRVRLS
ncbi:MAG: oligopeptide transporter permease OppB [Caulobacteraceae bacterium]|jgi:oligopeptide transport system permease protein|nr:oligopeptide transporter permease OppB [Caulobacteraceae bacterium]